MKLLHLFCIAPPLLVAACLGAPLRPAGDAPGTGPIIDMHVHAGPGTPESVLYEVRPGETPDAARLRFTLDEMRANNVVLALLSGAPQYTVRFRDAYPGRFLAGASFPCSDGMALMDPCTQELSGLPDRARLRASLEAGRLQAFGELLNVYAGISPADPRMQPYFDLAAEFDLVVAVHADRGPPPRGREPGCCPNFNGDYGSPALYRETLQRHPKLRLYLMHVIRPEFVQEAIALMRDYPDVYMDTSPMARIPEEMAHAALKQVIAAGYGDRIMFGSDDLGQVRTCVGVIEAATFLTPRQKRAIYHDNAARFLRRAGPAGSPPMTSLLPRASGAPAR